MKPRTTVGAAWQFVLVLAAGLLPFVFAIFPSQDGPSHIGTSAVLNRLLIVHDPHFEAFFEALPPSTNSLVHYLAMPLVLLLPARLAEKIIIAALIVGGALAVWSCARALKATNSWVCAFAAPAGYTVTLYTGNYNFILSFLLFFLILRQTLQAAGKFGVTGGLALSALFLLAALAHPIGAIFAMAGTGVLVLWQAWLDTRGLAGGPRIGGMLRHFIVPALAVLPALLLLGLYLGGHYDAGAEFGSGVRFGPGPVARLKSVIGLRQLYAIDNRQTLIVCVAGALSLAVLFAAALLARIRRLWSTRSAEHADGLLLVAATTLVLYLVIPDGGAGAGYIVTRLDLVPWLVVLVWLATRDFGFVERSAAVVLVGPVGLTLLAVNAIAIAKIEPELVALQQGFALLARGSTVLPIIAKDKPIYAFPGQGYIQNNPFQHMQDYAAADRAIVNLNNWNAHYPGFPIHFRSESDPYRFFDPVSLDDKDLAGFESGTGHPIDAVIVFGATPTDLADSHGALLATLDRLYCPRPIPASIGSLFVHRAADGACPAGPGAGG